MVTHYLVQGYGTMNFQQLSALRAIVGKVTIISRTLRVI